MYWKTNGTCCLTYCCLIHLSIEDSLTYNSKSDNFKWFSLIIQKRLPNRKIFDTTILEFFLKCEDFDEYDNFWIWTCLYILCASSLWRLDKWMLPCCVPNCKDRTGPQSAFYQLLELSYLFIYRLFSVSREDSTRCTDRM